jgi:Ca-activated chloride channel family protein
LSPDSANEFLPARSIDPQKSMASVSVSYKPSNSTAEQPESHFIDIAFNNSEPTPGMKLGQALIDEFTALHEATSAHHLRNDQEAAYQLLSALNERLKNNPDRELDSERTLVTGLLDQLTFLSGHGSEVKSNTPFARLWGRWKVTNASGNISIRVGEILEFMPDGNFKHFSDGKAAEPFEQEDYKSNESQVYLGDSDLVFSYGVTEKSLRLSHRESGAKVLLVRVPLHSGS